MGGVVLMRYGENPRAVLRRVKEKIALLESGLPGKTLADGRISKTKIIPFYDRTTIVDETINTLKTALFEEALLASLIVIFFLFHLRTTATILPTLPLALASSFILMYLFGIDSNIMSLAGLAIAIGDISDMGIIMSENIYRHLANASEDAKQKRYFGIIYDAATEVGGAIFTAVSNTIVSFLPVFFLTDQEGKLFRPLAFAKTFAIGSSVVLAITVVPFMCYLFFRPVKWRSQITFLLAALCGVMAMFATHAAFVWGFAASHDRGWLISIAVGIGIALCVVRMTRETFVPLDENPVSRLIAKVYSRTLWWILDHKKAFLLVPLLILFIGLTVWLGIHTTLYPVEAFVNLFAFDEASQELKQEMHLLPDKKAVRPLLELDQLRWQRIRNSQGYEKTRFLFRRIDPAEQNAEEPVKSSVIKEYRILPGLGREFMPPLDEGSFLYMPSLLPQASLSQVVEINSRQDRAIAAVPEVESVVGKIGRAESALDPAPIGMIETIVILKSVDEWRQLPVHRFFSGWPRLLKSPLAWIWPETRRITKDEILTELQERTAIPGVLPTWLQPIQTRLVMLQTGFRAMMGVKIYGGDLREIERIGLQMEQLLRDVPGAVDIVADRIVGKPYIQIEIDRERIARYGVTIRDVQDVIEAALGGINITESFEGRERYPIRVRLARDFREDLDTIGRISIPSSSGAQVPLAQLAEISTVLGPQEIKGERGLLVGYVTMNTRDRDEVSVVQDAEAVLRQALTDGRLSLPPGYYWEWSGQFENQVRATARMRILVPITLGIMFVMLYMGFTRWWIAPVIFFGVLVSASGGFIMLSLWGVNLSVAVWVGFLVLFGVVDDDGVVMATYLEGVFKNRSFASRKEIREAVLDAGLKRIRPCLMTIATTVIGLMPIFWATGRGSDVMKPMAIPSVGGMLVSLITLFIVPCVFSAVEEWKWKRARRD